MNNAKHYAAAISAFVIWGFFPMVLRSLLQYSSGEILYFRILLSSLVLIVVVAGFKQNALKENYNIFKALPKNKRYAAIGLTFLGGALLNINWLTFIYIVNNINITTASFSYLICPVLTAVLGFIVLKEKITVLQWIAVALCALSCVLMGLNSAPELGYSMLTALTYALYLISQRKNQGFDRMIVLGIQILFSFLLLNVAFPYLVTHIPVTPHFYIVLFIVAVFFTVFPLFLNLFALNKIDSATIGILMYINPLVGYAVAFVVYHEQFSSLQLVGYSIIALALVLFNYPNLKRMKTSIGSR